MQYENNAELRIAIAYASSKASGEITAKNFLKLVDEMLSAIEDANRPEPSLIGNKIDPTSVIV